MMLSLLSPTRSVALGGASAASQPAEVPPPPSLDAPVVTGEVVGLGLMFALIAIALTISDKAVRASVTNIPNSPA